MGVYKIEITGDLYVKGNSKDDKQMKAVVEEAFEECEKLKLLHKTAKVIYDTTQQEVVITPLSEIPKEELEKSAKEIYGIEWIVK